MHVKDIKYKDVIKIYSKIDSIKILPDIGRARVSCGPAYPPQGVQFVARGISFGSDGKEGTEDDLVLEPVDTEWMLAEEKTREHDDDLKYVKAPVINGLYTPVTTYGPIKERVQDREERPAGPGAAFHHRVWHPGRDLHGDRSGGGGRD